MKMKKLIAGLIGLVTVLTVTAACSKDKVDVDDVYSIPHFFKIFSKKVLQFY